MIKNRRRLYLIIAITSLVILVAIVAISFIGGNDDNEALPSQSTEQSTTTTQDQTNSSISYSNTSTLGRTVAYDDIQSFADSIINNYDQVVSNLPRDRELAATRMLLYALHDNNQSAIPADINIRNGSYSQTLEQDTMTYMTTYIVDIPSIQQSYRITDQYSPVEQYNPVNYATVVTCLDDSEQIYDFSNCTDQIKEEQGR